MQDYKFSPIGYIQSPFKSKFGVPRQASLMSSATGKILLKENADYVTAVKSLETFSHLWIVFVFHEHGGKKWKPSIRPPRLGGKRKVGVLASRSPHRPNAIGISAVRLEAVEIKDDNQVSLEISGLDCVDGTPVLDIKPYIPYADSIPFASAGWAADEIKKVPVKFSAAAENFLLQNREQNLSQMIMQILECDPRPAYLQKNFPIGAISAIGAKYGIEVLGHEVKYEIIDSGFLVSIIS